VGDEGLVLTVTNSLTLISAAGHSSTVLLAGKRAKHVSAVQVSTESTQMLSSPRTNKKSPQ